MRFLCVVVDNVSFGWIDVLNASVDVDVRFDLDVREDEDTNLVVLGLLDIGNQKCKQIKSILE